MIFKTYYYWLLNKNDIKIEQNKNNSDLTNNK